MTPGDNHEKIKDIQINLLVHIIYLMLNLVRRSFSS